MKSQQASTKRTHRREGGGRATEHGFTLLETVLALVTMMIVGLSVTSLFVMSIKSNAGASERTRCLAIAQQRMEIVRNTPYINLNAAFATANTQRVNLPDADGRMHSFWVATTVADQTNTNGTSKQEKLVTIQVWPLGAQTTGGLAITNAWAGPPITLRTYRAAMDMGIN